MRSSLLQLPPPQIFCSVLPYDLFSRKLVSFSECHDRLPSKAKYEFHNTYQRYPLKLNIDQRKIEHRPQCIAITAP